MANFKEVPCYSPRRVATLTYAADIHLLQVADLAGANLCRANLAGANLAGAVLPEEMLPVSEALYRCE